MPVYGTQNTHSLWRLSLPLVLAIGLGCATIEAPPGGPVDETPPTLVGVLPDSGTVGLPETQTIFLFFSEKMDPQSAERFLHLYPSLPVEKTMWHGRRDVEIVLAEPLPPDTVIVVEIPAGLKDAHRVPSRHSYRYPLATAAALPTGQLTGQLLYRDEPLLGGVVELYDVPPDTLEFFQQDMVRRAETDSLGYYSFPWLPVPGGPWMIRAFVDGNGDLRPGGNEATRLLPDDFSLSDTARHRIISTTMLYDPSTPGRLTGLVDSLLTWPGTVLGYSMAISEEDTGWSAAPQEYPPPHKRVVPLGDSFTFSSVPPGLVRLIFFVDANGDSMLSALPAAATTDTVTWYLEPYAVVDSLTVEPGLEHPFPTPNFPVTLSPWRSPTEAETDSTRQAGT